MGLQNCKAFLKVMLDSYSEIYAASQINSQINVELEGGSDIKVEEDAVDITFQNVKK
jgi:hypothetical protein